MPSSNSHAAGTFSKHITLLLTFSILLFAVALLTLIPAYMTKSAPLTPPSAPGQMPVQPDATDTTDESQAATDSVANPLSPSTGSNGSVSTGQDTTSPPVTSGCETETAMTDTAPVTDPPVTNSPVTDPPVTDPPATKPPVTDPPVTNPPVTKPPVTDPPVTEPPVTNPPVTDPPVTDPPVTDPPVTDPPVTNPPVTDPPVTDPPTTGAPYVDLIDPIEFADVLVKETPKADDSYIEKILFLGDSITNGLRGYGYLPGGKNSPQVLFPSKGTITLYQVKDVKVYDYEVQKEITVYEAIGRRQPELLFIALGVNGIGWESEKTFRKEYRNLLDAVLEVSPNTTIVLQSMLPVGVNYPNPEMLNNEKIAKGNLWIAEIAKEYGLTFLNIAPIMLDDNGYMHPDYVSGDGLHLDYQGYVPIMDFYKRHRIPGF